MRNLNEITITEAVNARLSADTPPRLRQIMISLTQHLHDFAREVNLTEAEWMQGIEFLTATGQKCDDKRQEFILLSDALGLSTLCVAMNNRKPAEATESTVFGPFYAEGADYVEPGADISHGASGVLCFVKGQIRSITGEAVPYAEIDVWHSDDAGFYDVQTGQDEFRCRARLQANDTGHFHFKTIKPAAYPIPDDGPVGQMLRAVGRHPWRPAHIHFMVKAPGFTTLISQVFEDGDPYLDSDAVFGVRSTLIGQYKLHAAAEEYEGAVIGEPFYTLDFDLVLSPAS